MYKLLRMQRKGRKQVKTAVRFLFCIGFRVSSPTFRMRRTGINGLSERILGRGEGPDTIYSAFLAKKSTGLKKKFPKKKTGRKSSRPATGFVFLSGSPSLILRRFHPVRGERRARPGGSLPGFPPSVQIRGSLGAHVRRSETGDRPA